MKLSEFKAGETVFIDANIFIYHFTGFPKTVLYFLNGVRREILLELLA